MDDELLIRRYRSFVEAMPPEERKRPTIIFIGVNEELSPEQVLSEMEKDTEIGREAKEAEQELLEHFKEKKKEFGLGVRE